MLSERERREVAADVARDLSVAISPDELVAAGRLGVLEAHREFDAKHASGATFKSFAFAPIQRRIPEAFAALGVPCGVYRAAQKDAAKVRAGGEPPTDSLTERLVERRVQEGAEGLFEDPFKGIVTRVEKNAVRAAIERLPDVQQRRVLGMMYVEGLAQSDVSERLRRSKTLVSRTHRDGVATVKKPRARSRLW